MAVCPAVRADDVNDLFLADERRGKDWKRSDITNVAPPFSSMWVEWQTPQFANKEVRRMGVLFEVQPELSGAPITIVRDEQEVGEPEWVVRYSEVWQISDFLLYAIDGLLFVDSTGRNLGEAPRPSSLDKAQRFHVSRVALLTLMFMHCKNIKMVKHEPGVKISRAHEKRHGKPLLCYHTLEIEPLKQVLATEGGIAHNGLKKALHICRGHFATYTHDKPLFGRVTGTVWKPAHVRGNASEGIVAKDYKVKV